MKVPENEFTYGGIGAFRCHSLPPTAFGPELLIRKKDFSNVSKISLEMNQFIKDVIFDG
jgi:hypothetical protein